MQISALTSSPTTMTQPSLFELLGKHSFNLHAHAKIILFLPSTLMDDKLM